ncbi:phosphopyruvate hydratase [candidate division WWE3 bacterium RIFCSPHIGHO2_01_FULL_40_23]|uniref:Enolase n=1 Tax=candidate division WWE3 bacterium RIFCSPLOWO2_01_FULL_41_18 TaxID=1802625 RepID=A0A1F4VCL5_UNCKA|nr:MAG: phosphopyruvate hydratase [candidate division WWE3 bacterium RIFCSPHIGHO2_01_FULL_40_23]OGC54945.1 MAG: phosphopyruvate hydratase [candidate division WWE3 bacterium RIFCSPLOWO2_01_FULL_41_18]
MPKISNIHAHKVLNSRGNWTISTEVELEDGSKGHGEIPEGASKGGFEAKSVDPGLAVDLINHNLGPNFCGIEASDQSGVDKRLIELDNTSDKSRLGENTTLSVSLAVANAMAYSLRKPLYRYLSEIFKTRQERFPTPLFNVINGGMHARNGLSFQEFLVVPARNLNYEKALDIGAKVYKILGQVLLERRFSLDIGDEGGYSPKEFSASSALGILCESIQRSGFKLYEEVFVGIDAASNSFYKEGSYVIPEERLSLDSDRLLSYYEVLKGKYPLIYIEDPFAEGDFKAWSLFNEKFGGSVLVVGDDLTVTNVERLNNALSHKCNNAVIVKPNQIGTLTETYQFVNKAKENNLTTIISHRSGEAVEDTFIADFAVAINADYLKAGAPAHERVAKYNRLLEIYGEINNIEGYCNLYKL